MNTPIETAIIARLVRHFKTTREMDWSITTKTVNHTDACFICTLAGDSNTYDVVLHQDGNLDIKHKLDGLDKNLVHALFAPNTTFSLQTTSLQTPILPQIQAPATPLPTRLRKQGAPVTSMPPTLPLPKAVAQPMVHTPLPRRMATGPTKFIPNAVQEDVANIQGLGQWQYWIDKNELDQWCVHLQNKDTAAQYNEDVKKVISTFGDVLNKTITITHPEFKSNIVAGIYELEKNKFTWDASLQKTNAPLLHEIVFSAYGASKAYGTIKEPEHLHAQVDQWSFVLRGDETLAADAWMVQLQHPRHHTELTQDPFLRSKIADLALEDDTWWLLVTTPLADAIEKIENLGVRWNATLQQAQQPDYYATANTAHNQAALQRDNKANATAEATMKENQEYQKKLTALKDQTKPGPFGDALDSMF